MKTKLILSLIISLVFVSLSFAQTPSQLFQQALLKENGEGNLKAAVEIYEKIVDDDADRSLRAKAQLHIGMCWEKMGKQEAINAYKLVLEQFIDQTSIVKEAKFRLTHLEQNKSKKNHIVQPKYKKIVDVEDWCNHLDCSPNGKWLVMETYAKEKYQVWIVERKSGKKRELKNLDICEGGDVRWSPLGNFISSSIGFANASEGGLWLLPVDQAKGKIIGNAEFIPVRDTFYSYDWASDEKKVCFSGRYEKTLGIIDIKQKSIEILSKDKLPKYNIRWSADGKYIYYFSPKGIYKFDIKSKNETRIGEGALIDVSSNGEYFVTINNKDPKNSLRISSIVTDKHFLLRLREDRNQQTRATFTPDGKGLLIPSWHEYFGIRSVDLNTGFVNSVSDQRGGFSQPVVSPRGDIMIYQEWKPAKNTLHIRNLKNNSEELIPLGGLLSRPSWSPDGSFIAFIDYTDFKKLKIFDMKTKEINTLAEHDKMLWYRINWSKDSKRVAYAATQEQQNAVFVTDIEANTQKIESSDNKLTTADWLDNGKKLLYVKNGKRWSDVIVYSFDTGKTRKICHTELSLSSPVVSPDERCFVAFCRERGKRNGLFYICSTEGGNLKKIGPTTPFLIEEDFVFWLPDSKHIFALIYEKTAGTTTHIHVLSIDSSEDRIVTQQDVSYKLEYSVTPNGAKAFYDAMTWTDGMVSEVDISEAIKKLK